MQDLSISFQLCMRVQPDNAEDAAPGAGIAWVRVVACADLRSNRGWHVCAATSTHTATGAAVTA